MVLQLDKWKKRYDIHKMKINGESGDVAGETIASRIPELLRGYSAANVWNLDETGCFWRALPEQVLGGRVQNGKEGKCVNRGLLSLHGECCW